MRKLRPLQLSRLRRALRRRAMRLYADAKFEIGSVIRTLGPKQNVRLNIGSGRRRWFGWICLDEIVDRGVTTVLFDERTQFPVEDESIQLAYTSHFLEHIADSVVDNVLREAWRCLAPGGILLVKIPDFDMFIDAYLNGCEARFEKIGLDSVVHTWGFHEITDDIDSRFAMMFCGYMNHQYGSHFTTKTSGRTPGAFHGPPRIQRVELHSLVEGLASSPHEIAKVLRKRAESEGEVFRWIHQNAWGRRELEALLVHHNFEILDERPSSIHSEWESVPDLGDMAEWSLFVSAQKPHVWEK